MKVFESIEIRGMRLKNRIGFPPFGNQPIGDDGGVSEDTVRWYEDRIRGGAAFIVSGPLRVHTPKVRPGAERTGTRIMRGWGINDDSYIPGLAWLTDAVHAYGAKIGAYIGAGGPVTGKGPSPSPYPDELHAKDDCFGVTMGYRVPVREVSIAEIEQAENDIAAAAERAKKAGFDFVNLPSANGGASLHGSFLSPFYNRRTDRYGGSWENRLRIVMETLRKMREAVGDNYPIFIRISGDELLGKRGITIEDVTTIIVPALEKAGVDCLDISQGAVSHSMDGQNIPLYYPRGHFIHLAAAVKQVTKLPVIGVGSIFDLDMAEKFLNEGKADIICMGRQLTADPETPKKYFEGRREDIRKCIGCLSGCGSPSCTVNYDMQSEKPLSITPAQKMKRVLVIGGGVGGMEAARIAALRGHEVTLIEKDSHLGGMVAALALTSLTAEFGNIVDYLAAQMKKLKVDVRVCQEAIAATVKDLQPDVVIVATGSSMLVPDVVKGKPGVLTHIDALRKKREIGHKVVIWGLAAAELAISLAEEGKDVILMGRGGEDTLAKDYPTSRRFWILRKLTDLNLVREFPEAERTSNPQVLYYVDVEAVTSDGISIVNRDGNKRVLPYDTLIVSREREANDSLFKVLNGMASEVYRVGDCSQPGEIRQAIRDANEIARKI